MIKVIVTDAVVSKGFNGAPALRFSENNNAVQFKFGKRVYDTRAEGNHRYINLAAKAFGPVCERVEKMKLKEGSFINLIGRLDEEKWDDNGQQLSRYVVIIEDVEYAGGGKANGNGNGTNGNGAGSAPPANNGQGAAPQNPQGQQATQQPQNQQAAPQQSQNAQGEQMGMPSGFTGYGSFGEENPFYPGN